MQKFLFTTLILLTLLIACGPATTPSSTPMPAPVLTHTPSPTPRPTIVLVGKPVSGYAHRMHDWQSPTLYPSTLPEPFKFVETAPGQGILTFVPTLQEFVMTCMPVREGSTDVACFLSLGEEAWAGNLYDKFWEISFEFQNTSYTISWGMLNVNMNAPLDHRWDFYIDIIPIRGGG